MSMNMPDGKPKIFGELGLGTTQLEADVKKAKEQISSLAEQAKKLGEIFNSLGIKNNLGKVSTGLENTASQIKKTTNDVKKQFEDSAKEISLAKQKVVEAISHNVKMENISQWEGIKQLENYISMLRGEMDKVSRSDVSRKGWATRKGVGFSPSDTSVYTNEIVKAESLWKDYHNRTKVETHNFVMQVDKDQLASTRTTLRSELDLIKAQYQNKILNHIEYLKRLEQIEQQGQGVLTKRDLTGISKQRIVVDKNIDKGVDAQLKAIKEDYEAQDKLEEQHAQTKQKSRLALEQQRSKEITDEAINRRKIDNAIDLQDHKAHLTSLIRDERIHFDDRIRLAKELKSVTDAINKSEVADIKKKTSEKLAAEKKSAADTLAAQKKAESDRLAAIKEYNQKEETFRNSQLGSAQQRFRSLTNYAFDASLIYGGIQTTKDILKVNSDVEMGQTNLQRIMPSSTSKSDMEFITNQAFETAKITAQSVGDVQKIQNLWARVSDDIANSKELLTSLTKVTATGMNVGGFTNAEEAVQLLSAALNQMGIGWESASKVMDSWIKVADTTAVKTAKDLADNIMRTGSQAKLLGIDINQLNGIAGMFANNMAKTGQEIGTAMRTVFSYFQDENTIKILERYGVEVKKNKKEFNDFGFIMQQLNDKYKELKLDKNDQAIHEINNALGRIRRVDYVGTLLENWGQVAAITQTSVDAQGYALEQNEKVMDTYEKKVAQLKAAFEELAWSIGQSGLLDDMKQLVTMITHGIDAFNAIDPAMKTFILRLTEFSAVVMLVSKSSQILTGVGLSKLLANTGAEIAYLTKNTTLFNLALRAKADIQMIDTGVTTADTIATQSNTISKGQNNAVKQTGTIVTTGKTAATNTESAALAANTARTITNAEANIALNNSKLVGAGATGVFASAIGGLLNPLNLLIMGVGLVIGGLYSYRQAQEQARIETEKMTEAQKDLQATVQGKVVPETSIPEQSKKLSDLEDLRSKYEDISVKLADAQKAEEEYSKVIAGRPSAGRAEAEEMQTRIEAVNGYKNQLSQLETQMGLLGSSSSTLNKDIDNLTEVVNRSTDSTLRSAYGVINLIETKQKLNIETLDEINRFEELSQSMTATEKPTQEYHDLVVTLASKFPALSNGIKDANASKLILIKTMRDQIGTIGTLNQAQLTEIASLANLSQTAKQSAIDIVNVDIQKTEAIKANALARVDAFRQEQDAYRKEPSPIPNDNSPEALWLRSMNKRVYSGVEGELKKDADKADVELQRLVSARDAIDKIKTADQITAEDTPLSSAYDPKKETGKQTYYPEVDRYQKYQHALSMVNNELEVTKKWEDRVADSEKFTFMMKEIGLLDNKKKALHDINEERRNERDEIQAALERYGFNIENDTVLNPEHVTSFVDDTAKKVEKLLKDFGDLVVNQIPKASTEWMEADKRIIDITKEFIDNRVSNAKNVEQKLVEIVKKRIEEELEAEKKKNQELQTVEEDRHKKRLKQLDEEKKKNEDFINARLKLIDQEDAKKQYDDELAKLTKDRQDLLDRYNILQLDDSDSGKFQSNELKKQIDEKDKEIEKAAFKRGVDVRKENLKDQLDNYKEDHDKAVETENDKYEAEKNRLDQSIKDTEETYKKKLEKGNLYSEAYKLLTTSTITELTALINQFEDNVNDGMSIVGKSIKENLIDNLRDAIALMNTVGYAGTGDLDKTAQEKLSANKVNQMLFEQSFAYMVAAKQNNQSGMITAHDRAEAIRRQTGRPIGGTDGSLDMEYENWLKETGNDKVLMNINSSSVLPSQPNVTPASLSPITTSSGVGSSSVLGALVNSLPRIGGLSLSNLININGDVASDKLNNVESFANLVFDKLFQKLKIAGVV